MTARDAGPSSMPSDRSLRARAAAHARWAKHDPVSGTVAARNAFLDRFDREVDPDNRLDPDERARRAGHARRRYFLDLARRSAAARRARSTSSRSG